jgi:hypothetical protein
MDWSPPVRPGRQRTRARVVARAVAMGLSVTFLVLALAGTATAYTVTGGTKLQRQMVKEVLEYNPELLALVENVWPDFTVRINYGGKAGRGIIDVNIRRHGRSFNDQVIHEFGHEVQLAADAKGGVPQIDNPWRQELIDRGFPESTWVWRLAYPHYGRLNPFECFAENIGMLWPADYHYAPDTKLARLTAQEMWAFLDETGVLP